MSSVASTDEIERAFGRHDISSIHEVAQDIVREMGAPSNGFTMHDFERLQAMTFSGMADLEDSIRRVIAMRTWE